MIRKEDIIYKPHALQRMGDRGITKEQVRRALERGAKFKQSDGLLSKYTYFSVAYKKVGSRYIIKTIMVN